ncbi:MAG TPA: hypothetical protein VHG51_13530 [Longimicrobiaceae bacterium]|nr:hypothetical protein [Longimicrobiaceae bacterium]
MSAVRRGVPLAALLAAAGCATAGSAPPETVSGSFALVRIEGDLQPLERARNAPPGGGGGDCAVEGRGEVELGPALRFELDVVQRSPCSGEVRRELRGTYYRRGEHLGFEALLPGGATVRFHGTTNDTTVVVRLSGAELVFARAADSGG